jgi:hypothetical protein
VDICFSLMRTTGVNALRLCQAEDLIEALKILAPYAKRERCPPIRLEAANHLHAVIDILLTAQRCFATVWNELVEYRKRVSNDRLECEAKDTADRIMARLEEQRAAFKRAFEVGDVEAMLAWPDVPFADTAASELS